MTTYYKPTLGEVYSLYRKLNAEIFENKLPKIEIKFTKSTKFLGYYRSHLNRINGTVKPLRISISNIFNLTEKAFTEVLIHEMIHLQDSLENTHLYVRKGYNAHGYYFKLRARQIKETFGYTINVVSLPDEEGVDRTAVREKINNKKVFALFFILKEKKCVLFVSGNAYLNKCYTDLKYLSKHMQCSDLFSVEMTQEQCDNVFGRVDKVRSVKGGYYMGLGERYWNVFRKNREFKYTPYSI